MEDNVYKVIDFCLAQQQDGVKREIMRNGPVIAQINPQTDFLTYSEGVYHRTPDAFKFQGNHVMKVVGWEDHEDQGSFWIAQNSWGSDWGEEGYVRVAMGETMLDQFAIGFAVYPGTTSDYEAQQKAQSQEYSF